MATTAYQTIFGERSRERREAEARGEAPVREDGERKPPLLNSCHAFGESSPVVAKLWPRWFRPADDVEAAKARTSG